MFSAHLVSRSLSPGLFLTYYQLNLMTDSQQTSHLAVSPRTPKSFTATASSERIKRAKEYFAASPA